MPILAGGTALFAVVSVVPILAATVALYGMIADPTQIDEHLHGLESILPPQVVSFIADQLARKAASLEPRARLAVAISVIVAHLASRGAARALIDSLNRAYRVREQRRTLQKLLVTLAMAGGTLIGTSCSCSAGGGGAARDLRDRRAGQLRRRAVAALAGADERHVLHAARAYRYAPSPRPLGTVRHLWPGALTATILVVIVSVGLVDLGRSRRRVRPLVRRVRQRVVVLFVVLPGGDVARRGRVRQRRAGAPRRRAGPDRSMY